MKKISDSEKLKRLQEEFNSLKAESNKEISELKKERRELKAKITNFDTKLSSAYNLSLDMKKLEEENLSLKDKMKDIDTKTDKYYSYKYEARFGDLKYQLNKSKERIQELRRDVASDIAWRQKYKPNPTDEYRMKLFNNGEMYDEKKRLFFSTEDLFIRYNPKNGRPLDEFDILILEKIFEYNVDFLWIRGHYNGNKQYVRNLTQEQLDAYAYKEGMELLPIYKDYIL